MSLADARFLTVAEVADMMRVSRMTVYRLVHSGDLPAIRFGRSFRVPESAVEDALQTLGTRASWRRRTGRPEAPEPLRRTSDTLDRHVFPVLYGTRALR